MINFFKSLFGASIPSTGKYEGKLRATEQALEQLNKISSSQEYNRYLELKKLTSAPQFSKKIEETKRLKYKGSSEDLAEQRLASLKKEKSVKEYLKTGQSDGSSSVASYIKLQEDISSPEFQENKSFLLDKNRHKKSEEFKLQQEYEKLSKSSTITSYAKVKKRYLKTLNEKDSWEVTFEEDFTLSPFSKKWSTAPFWSEALLKESYAQANEEHLPTDGRNLESQGGLVSIITRKEEQNGLAWHEKYGFIPRTFHYTSGVMNTSGTFRQQYGRFVAKIRMTQAQNVYHAFWLGAEKMLPHITICKVENGRMTVGAHTDAKSDKKNISHRIKEDFYIFELLWKENELLWLINGKKIHSTIIRVNTPLYIAFSSGVTGEVSDYAMPQRLSIEWVRSYKHL